MSRVTVVRIYFTEGDHRLKALFDYLNNEHSVGGVTAYRGILGFGKSGKVHAVGLSEIDLDLPLVLEFFDEPEKVERILAGLGERVKPGHILHWTADVQ